MEELDELLGNDVMSAETDLFGEKKKEEPAKKPNDKKPVNLWSEKNITAIDIDPTIFKKTKKTFSIALFNNAEKIPDATLETLGKIVNYLIQKGYVYRNNGEKTSQLSAFTSKLAVDKQEFILPWKKFNLDAAPHAVMTSPNEKGYGIAKMHRGAKYMEMNDAARALIANNTHLVVGAELTEPLDILIVYNKDGSESLGKKPDYKQLGNTAYYLKLAELSNVAVFNVKNSDAVTRLSEFVKSKEQPNIGE